MGIRTLLKFYLGSGAAIRQIAANRWSIWIGLLLVFSAALAREYDGEFLLAQPWHLLTPAAASLVTSLILFGLLEISFTAQGATEVDRPVIWARYRSFLGLYWMTAPLAWLYAIPMERMFDAAGSVQANLALLGIVALWRVALFVCVVYHAYDRTVASSFFVVMLFADAVAMGVFWMTPLPILSIMGGIRLTESEQILQSTGLMIRFFGVVLLPVWLIGHVATCSSKFQRQSDAKEWALGRITNRKVSLSLCGLILISLLGWLPVLPITQAEQRNRYTVETLIESGQIEDALKYMSAREQSDFPPHWDLPPRIGYGESKPTLIEMLLAIESINASDWVRQQYHDKLALQTRSNRWSYMLHTIQIDELSDQDLEGYVSILESSPRGAEVAANHDQEVRTLLNKSSSAAAESPISDERRQLLQRILELVPPDADTEGDQPSFSPPDVAM